MSKKTITLAEALELWRNRNTQEKTEYSGSYKFSDATGGLIFQAVDADGVSHGYSSHLPQHLIDEASQPGMHLEMHDRWCQVNNGERMIVSMA